MAWDVISKNEPARVPANLGDYDAGYAAFDWGDVPGWLSGQPDGGRNIAVEAVDRHVAERGDQVALRFLGKTGVDRELTYADLAAASSRFANVLAGLGVAAGDRVFGLMGRQPELYSAILGTLKHRAAFCPLFSAFGPEPVKQRLQLGQGSVLVTTPNLYRKKVAPIRDEVPHLRHVLLVGPGMERVADAPGVVDLLALLEAASDEYTVEHTNPERPALVHFTSGTTGTPKGAVHVHDAVLGHHATARFVLDLHDDDIFWCTADPGWVTGTSYGVVAPLTCGVTVVVDELEFDARRWYSILEEQKVSVWYTAPTALRMLMKAGAEQAKEHDLSALRHVLSVGEPLNPEVVVWGMEALGLPIHDTWWQTETGSIMIANYASAPIRPGSMGRPVPGIEAALLARDEHGDPELDADGMPVLVTEPDVDGEILLRAPWPSMMREYLGMPERYAKAFIGGEPGQGWYRSGDLGRRDADGWFWFVGRGDDVIKSAGHLIGPFEVESVLMEHPAVAEAGVIGVPDPVAGEVVKAFVALRAGYEPSDELTLELVGFARKRLGAAVAPRQIEVKPDLPKTRSGKIMRRLLKARELGLPEGDLSTLESGR
jgi:acetyl-CoA synthetase